MEELREMVTYLQEHMDDMTELEVAQEKNLIAEKFMEELRKLLALVDGVA